MFNKCYLSIAVVAIGCLFVQGCGNSTYSSSPGGAPEHMVQGTASVVRRDIVGFEILPATLYTPPEAQASIIVNYPAPVQQVLVTPGQYVRRGQLLVQLVPPDVRSAVQDAKASLQAAETAYADAKTKYDQPVSQARQQLQQAKDAEIQARQAAQSGGDGTDLQQATATRQQAEQALLQAEADEKTNLLTYQQQLDAARTAYKEGRADIREGSVTAPISGTVLALNVQAGQQVGTDPHQSIGTVADLDAIEIKSNLTDDQMTRIHVGTPIEIVFQDVPNRVFNGQVARIRSVPGPGAVTVHEATIRFRNTDHLVKPTSTLSRVGVRIGD